MGERDKICKLHNFSSNERAQTMDHFYQQRRRIIQVSDMYLEIPNRKKRSNCTDTALITSLFQLAQPQVGQLVLHALDNHMGQYSSWVQSYLSHLGDYSLRLFSHACTCNVDNLTCDTVLSFSLFIFIGTNWRKEPCRALARIPRPGNLETPVIAHDS